jgi:hypothetical protein
MIKKKKLYFYVISFIGDGEHGEGNFCSQIYWSKKICTPEDFIDLLEFLKAQNKLDRVIINNLMFMGRVKA